MIYRRCTLTAEQYADAVRIADRIYRNGRQWKRQVRYGQHMAALPAANKQGTLAAKAFAVMEGVPYEPGNTPDWRVNGYNIRSTEHERGHLLLHPKDDPQGKFVLLIGFDRAWGIAGWCYGAEREGYWRNTVRPAFFVPQRVLHAWPPDGVQLALLR